MSKDLDKWTDEELKNRLKKIEIFMRDLAYEKKEILKKLEISRRRFLRPPRRLVIALSISLIVAYAIFLRCLHLLRPDHYYMISPDSYIFHRMAERILAGQPPLPDPLSPRTSTIMGTGLAYPLASIATLISYISQTPPSDALTLTCKYLPPILAIVTIPLIFLMATKTHDWTVGLSSAFVWAILPFTYVTQAAGYIDRDGLTMLLIMLGVFTFYLSKDWRFKLANRNLGWMLAALSIIGIEGILFLEWNFGPLILLVILTACFTAEFLGNFLQGFLRGFTFKVLLYYLTDWKRLADIAKDLPERFITAIRESNWRPFTLIVSINALALSVSPEFVAKTQEVLATIFYRKESYIAEAQYLITTPLPAMDGYRLLIIPLLIGLYIALRKRRRGDIFWLGWYFGGFLGFFAGRALIYVAPAVCVLCGLVLAPIINFRLFRPTKKIVAVLLLIALIFLQFLAPYAMGSDGRLAPNNSWYSALTWLKENTPEDAVVMTWRDYGYWIIDIANRTPVVDNTWQYYEENKDVALAYCNDTNVAIEIMEKHGAHYLIFSKVEVAILPTISEFALGRAYGDGFSVPEELKSSLYNRVMFENFTPESGLKVVKKIPDINSEVAILKLEK